MLAGFVLQACAGVPERELPGFAGLSLAFEEQLAGSRVAAASAAIVRDGELVWSHGFGMADVEQQRPATVETLFQLASISKTVTACVVMQAVEQGLLELDGDINEHLPFHVEHPAFPNQTITLRQLLTHTAGLRDNWKMMDEETVLDGDFAMQLGPSLESYLVPGAHFYDAERNFAKWAPNSKYDYCNIGIALAAYMAEVAFGEDFALLARKQIFEPLGMERSSFRLEGMPLEQIAVPHAGAAGSLKRLGHHGYIDYPAGTMRASAGELSLFLLAMMAGGELDGVRLLKRETVAEMFRIQRPGLEPGQGLVWYTSEMDGELYWGHNGGDPGVSTEMLFSMEGDYGVIFLSTGSTRGKLQNTTVQFLLDAAHQ